MLKVLILPPNVFKIRIFSRKFETFGRKFSTRRIHLGYFPTARNLGEGKIVPIMPPPATMPLRVT